MTYSVGFVGGGTIADWHAERVRDLGHVVGAVADIDDDARRAFAETHGATETYEDYERMFAEANIDVAVVAIPNAFHEQAAVAALEAGLHVLVEKPLAHTLESAERIAEAAADSPGEVFVGFMSAFEPATQRVRREALAGAFGDVYEVDIEYVRRRGIPQIGSWFTRKDLAGGGALVDIGVHVVHLALATLDFPEIEAVSATTGTHFGDREDYTYHWMWGGDPTGDETFDVEDHARAIVRTADGTIALNCAWAGNRDGEQSIRILGDEAGVTFDLDSDDPMTVYTTDDGALIDESVQLADTDVYAAEWSYLFEVVEGERPHEMNTVEEGLAVQRVIDAVYRSAEQHREVRLTE